MIVLRDKTKCTGCTACAAACPLDSIAMMADKDGFLYPEIGESRCTSCGKCDVACPVSREHLAVERSEPEAYGVKADDLQLRLGSSSGGVFSLLAEEVLGRGGIVFGAAMAPDCKSVCHAAAETAEELAALRGSKYVQSNMEDTYRRVKMEAAHRPILFTGTPCQVDGLKSFLGRERENLLCAEVICHGAPAPKLWVKYAEHIAAESGGRIVKVEFRDKRFGWKHFALRIETSGSEPVRTAQGDDPYMRMFLRDLCLRPACYQCPSKGLNRSADLTIGDFWGIESVAPELDDDKGTSLVLVHTDRGREALKRVLPRTQWKKVDCMAALRGNPAMLESVPEPSAREAFMNDMDRLPFRELAKKYVPMSKREQGIALLEKLGLLPQARRMYRALRQK